MAGQTVSIEKKVLIKFITDTLGAKQAVAAMQKVDNATGKVDKGTKTLSSSMLGLAKRAAMVAPIWMVVRGAMNLARRAIGDIIGSYLELDKGMRKVIAVTNTVGKEQIRIYGELERRARIAFTNTARSMTEVTEAMYQIGTAGRSTEEILEGFEHVLNLAVGTFGNVAVAGKTVSGILNVFEHQLKRVGDTSQQIQYVSDLLAVAWRNNQIELSEVAQSMQYLASEGNVLDISLEELIASSSVLNDAMLRGGKGGRLLARAFVQIAKDSDKLRRLGVLFDPNKPLKFRDIMSQLHKIYEKQRGSLTFLKDLTDIFGTRGKRAVTGLLTQWEKFNEEIDRTPEEIRGSAEELKEIAEGSWGDIMKKMWRAAWAPPSSAVRGEGRSIGKEFAAGIVQGMEEARRRLEKLPEIFNIMGKNLDLTKQQLEDLYEFIAERSPRAGRMLREIYGVIPPGYTGRAREGLEVFMEITKNFESNFELVKAYKQVMAETAPEEKVNKATGKEVILRKAALGLLEQIKSGEKEISELKSHQVEALFRAFGIQVTFSRKLKEALELYKKTAQEAEKKKKQEEVAIAALTSTQQLQVRQISNEAKLTQLKIQGASRAEVAEQKLLNLLDERREKIKNTAEFQKLSQEDQKKWLVDWDQLLLAGLDDLEKWGLTLVQAGTEWKEASKIVKAMRDRIMEMRKEIDVFSDKLEKSFSTAFANLLKGEDTVNQFFNNIVDSWRSIVLENISGTLTEQLFGFTGMGEQFGGMMVGIQSMFKSPAKRTGDVIGNSLIRAAEPAGRVFGVSALKTLSRGAGGGGAAGRVLDLGAMAVYAGGGGGGVGVTPPMSDAELSRALGATSGAGKKPGFLQKLGGLLNLGLGTYGAYEAAGGGLEGAGAGLSMGAGMLLGGPLGTGLMVLSAIFGMFNKKTVTSIEESEISSSSRLDHINTNLEIINRSIIGKKAGFEPYPFRESAYFQARPSTGVQVQAINISVGSEAQGQDVVKAIQDEFNISSLRVLQ